MKTLSILSVGNSFSADTMEHLPLVALQAGYSSVFIGNLYIGGCSVRKHFANLQTHLAVYTYHTNDGTGWKQTPSVSIEQAIAERDWDIISIQQGTLDGSCYSNLSDYDDLPALAASIHSLAGKNARVAFNMTWVGEPDFDHHEIRAYNGDTERLFCDILRLTKEHIVPMDGIDAVSPAGLGIQYARKVYSGKLTCDGYHLSKGLGRLIAALTFLMSLTGTHIDSLECAPEGVTETEKALAIDCARRAANDFTNA